MQGKFPGDTRYDQSAQPSPRKEAPGATSGPIQDKPAPAAVASLPIRENALRLLSVLVRHKKLALAVGGSLGFLLLIFILLLSWPRRAPDPNETQAAGARATAAADESDQKTAKRKDLESGAPAATVPNGTNQEPKGTKEALPAAKDDKKASVPVTEEQKIVDLINQARVKEKLPPLKTDEKLSAAVRAYTAEMVKQNNPILDIGALLQHLLRTGFFGSISAYMNQGTGQSVEEAFQGWMIFPQTKANILNKDFEFVAVGAGKTKQGEVFYLQVYSRARR